MTLQRDHHVIQSNPFRGMLPKKAKQPAQDTEENEDEMASRLHLDLGKYKPADSRRQQLTDMQKG